MVALQSVFVDPSRAVNWLAERLPEFAPAIDEHRETFDELLFHLLMGGLARFYMSQGQGRVDPELARRYWMTVERMAMEGDDFVTNALGVSLIESFAWGDENQKAALREAMPRFGPEPQSIAARWANDLRAGEHPPRSAKRRSRRPTQRI